MDSLRTRSTRLSYDPDTFCLSMRWVLIVAVAAGGLAAKEPPAAREELPRWELTRPEPVPYPPLARQARIEGVVRLRMRVKKDRWLGRPVEVEAIEGHPLLEGQAVSLAEQWRFERVKGKTNWFFAEIEFRLFDCHRNEPMMLEKSVSYWTPPNRIEVRGCMVQLQTQSAGGGRREINGKTKTGL